MGARDRTGRWRKEAAGGRTGRAVSSAPLFDDGRRCTAAERVGRSRGRLAV